MTPEELRSAAVALFGPRGWMTDLAACLRVDRSTVHRWMNSGSIPGPVEAAVSCWMDRFKSSGEKPELPERGGG